MRKGATMQPISISTRTLHIMHNDHMHKNKQVMLLLPSEVYAPGLDLLRVKLLKTCALWTSRNHLLNLLLHRNESTDDRPYTR
jgi:hypothetical protein